MHSWLNKFESRDFFEGAGSFAILLGLAVAHRRGICDSAVEIEKASGTYPRANQAVPVNLRAHSTMASRLRLASAGASRRITCPVEGCHSQLAGEVSPRP